MGRFLFWILGFGEKKYFVKEWLVYVFSSLCGFFCLFFCLSYREIFVVILGCEFKGFFGFGERVLNLELLDLYISSDLFSRSV